MRRSRILIVDRNPNVGEYLKRELECEGHHIRLAENCRELFQMLADKPEFDVIIIDPDLPDVEERRLLQELQDLHPRIPVVIHTLAADDFSPGLVPREALTVEKDGNSIECLKQVVDHLPALRRRSPGHFQKPPSSVGR